MDEHLIGLKPVIRRVWMLKGHRPIIRGQHRYEWLYVYGFARPESGDTIGCYCPRSMSRFSPLLWSSSHRRARAGPDRRIILVLDRAGWHSSQTIVVAFRHPARVSPILLDLRCNGCRASLAALQRGYRQSSLRAASCVCLTYSSPRYFFEILIVTRLLRQLNHSCPPCTFVAGCPFRN
jgi:hypothetical protein